MAQYYKVTVYTPFWARTVEFLPNHEYKVKPEIYQGQTDDGRKFADLCVKAEPVEL
jgi:hypothetical protein